MQTYLLGLSDTFVWHLQQVTLDVRTLPKTSAGKQHITKQQMITAFCGHEGNFERTPEALK